MNVLGRYLTPGYFPVRFAGAIGVRPTAVVATDRMTAVSPTGTTLARSTAVNVPIAPAARKACIATVRCMDLVSQVHPNQARIAYVTREGEP